METFYLKKAAENRLISLAIFSVQYNISCPLIGFSVKRMENEYSDVDIHQGKPALL